MTQQFSLLRTLPSLPDEYGNAPVLSVQSARRPQEVTYQPAPAEPEPSARLQRLNPNHGMVMVGDKKRAVVFLDAQNNEQRHVMQQTLSLCERYHYDVLVVDVGANDNQLGLDKTARHFLRIDTNEALISLQSPQLDRSETLSWLFSANTAMALDVAKAGLRLVADTHIHAPYTRKKLNQKTDIISVTTHPRLADDAANTVLTSPYLIVALSNHHAQQLISTYGTAHAVVHGGHRHDCERMNELAQRMATKVAVFHPDPPKRLASAGKISLAALRADNAVVITTSADMVRALKDLSKPTGGAPVFPERPGTRKGGTVHAAQFL